MATNPQHSSPIRNTIADLVGGTITAITGGTAFIVGSNLKLKLYTGTPPATPSTALSGNTAASSPASFGFNATAPPPVVNYYAIGNVFVSVP